MSKLSNIVETLAIALREITVERGYNTNIGDCIHTAFLQQSAANTPLVTVLFRRVVAKSDGSSRPGNTRRGEGVISLIVPSEFPRSQEFAFLALEDVERRLTVNRPMMPGALPVQLEETNFLYPEPGLPVLLAEIGFSTEWRV